VPSRAREAASAAQAQWKATDAITGIAIATAAKNRPSARSTGLIAVGCLKGLDGPNRLGGVLPDWASRLTARTIAYSVHR
jgi:hypothetical protein